MSGSSPQLGPCESNIVYYRERCRRSCHPESDLAWSVLYFDCVLSLAELVLELLSIIFLFFLDLQMFYKSDFSTLSLNRALYTYQAKLYPKSRLSLPEVHN